MHYISIIFVIRDNTTCSMDVFCIRKYKNIRESIHVEKQKRYLLGKKNSFIVTYCKNFNVGKKKKKMEILYCIVIIHDSCD